jgi:hypothetical protein
MLNGVGRGQYQDRDPIATPTQILKQAQAVTVRQPTIDDSASCAATASAALAPAQSATAASGAMSGPSARPALHENFSGRAQK